MARVVVALLLCASAAQALTVTGLFGDHMVLQSAFEGGTPSVLTGTGLPGEVITLTGPPSVTPSKTAFTTAVAADGTWRIVLDNHIPASASESYTLVLTSSASSDKFVAQDVRYGDVFVCSGQSNMAVPLSYAYNATDYISDAQNWPNIRMFTVARNDAALPASVVSGAWTPASSASVANFSAVCYLTIREVMRLRANSSDHHSATLGVYGLIQAAVGSTCIESWMNDASLADAYECGAKAVPCGGISNTSALYNGMIHPLMPYAIRSLLWDQGECNTHTSNTKDYTCLFSAMIRGWRNAWDQGDFAFNFVQLGAYVDGNNVSAIRLGQHGVLPRPNYGLTTTGMAASYDLGSPCPGDPAGTWCIHCRNKTEVGRRLALQVLHTAFGWQDTSFSHGVGVANHSGPSVESATAFKANATWSVSLRLRSSNGLSLAPAQGCTTCCASSPFQVSPDSYWLTDAKWYSPAAVTIVRDRITLANITLPDGAERVRSVRYAIADVPQCVLYNADGIPANPLHATAAVASPEELAVLMGSRQHKIKDGHPPQESKLAQADAPGVTMEVPLDLGEFGGKILTSPPAGFNSWNFFHVDVNEVAIRNEAYQLVELGLADAGYRYVNIDAGWAVARLANGSIVSDPTRFPTGIKSLASYIHKFGLLFGLYTASSPYECTGRPGSYGFEAQDATTYCEWGLDYIKIDFCGQTYPNVSTSWSLFRQALAKCPHPIAMSVEYCSDPADCGTWVASLADVWRTTTDVQPNFDSIMYNLDNNDIMHNVSNPAMGKFNDPDLLEVGNSDALTFDEQKTQFALWCLVNAPLLITADLRVLGQQQELMDMLRAPEVLAINRDPTPQGTRVSPASPGGVEVWAKSLSDGSVAVALLNRSPATAPITVTFSGIGLGPTVHVRDPFAQADEGVFQGQYTQTVCSHCTHLIVARTSTEAASSSNPRVL